MSAAPVFTLFKNGEKIAESSVEADGILGRSDGCLIRLEDRAISRQHALLRLIDNGLQIESKSDFAPLSVNGVEVSRALLKESDVISIGPFIGRVSYAKEEAPPPVPAEAPSLPSAEAATITPAGELQSGLMSEPTTSGPVDPNAATQSVPFEAGDAAMFQVSEPGAAALSAALDSSVALSMNFENPNSKESNPTQLVSDDDLKVKITLNPSSSEPTVFEMTDAKVVLGRTKDCQIVLKDKKASRRHARIDRKGKQFFLTDLDTVNGTLLNGSRISGEVELSGDDLIMIGETEIQFQVISSDYEKKDAAFGASEGDNGEPSIQQAMESAMEQNSSEPAEVVVDENELAAIAASAAQSLGAAQAAAQFSNQIPNSVPNLPPVDMASLAGAVPQGKQTLLEKFRALPKQRQAIWAVIIAGIMIFLFFEESDIITPKKEQAKPKAAAGQKVDPNSATFESLTPDQQRFVETQYTLALDLYKNKDYDKSIFELRKIFQLLPDYKDAREIERYAQEGKRKLEAFEEDKKKKDEAERVKARVAQLVEQTQKFMMDKKYVEAQQMFSDILELDPENVDVSRWKAELADVEERKRIRAEGQKRQKESASLGWKELARGRALQKQEKYYAAIASFQRSIELAAHQKKLIDEAKEAIEQSRQAIHDKAAPFLEEALQAEKEGHASAAYKAYKKAALADPRSKEAYAGIERVRASLHDQSKRIYTEGVLAESYSDFQTAITKFKECLDVAPEDDIYSDRAKSKLKRYAPYGKLQEGG